MKPEGWGKHLAMQAAERASIRRMMARSYLPPLMRDFEDGGRRPRHEERCRRYLIANGPEKMRIIEEAIWDHAMKVHWKECTSLLKKRVSGRPGSDVCA